MALRARCRISRSAYFDALYEKIPAYFSTLSRRKIDMLAWWLRRKERNRPLTTQLWDGSICRTTYGICAEVHAHDQCCVDRLKRGLDPAPFGSGNHEEEK